MKKHLNTFTKGLGTDFHPNVPLNEFLRKGVNGRLFSEGSVMAYKSLKGTTLVYTNANIVKYLGFLEFDNELLIFVKTNEVYIDAEEDLGFWNREINDLDIEVPYNSDYGATFPVVLYDLVDNLDLLDGVTTTQILYSTLAPRAETEIIADTFTCDNIPLNQNLQNYTLESDITFPGYKVCNIVADSILPENNLTTRDAIISLKISNGALIDDVRWIGLMNWDINRKIIARGIEESNRTKRVYFTDNLNYFRSFNLRDEKLQYREPDYFSLNKRTLLNQPTITQKASKGQLKAMSVQYAYRLITAEGQITAFSPYSKMIKILKNDLRNNYQGGDVSEVTTNSVSIETKIAYSTLYEEIEMIAIEYESGTVPTNIISLGVKPSKEVVYFDHFGNESEYESIFTLAEILDKKNRWQFCSDLEVKDNRLLASAPRNEPFPNELKYYEDMFLLKGWNAAGATHDCLINPEPYTYRYIDPSNQNNFNRITKTRYTIFEIYGRNTIRLTNTAGAGTDWEEITFDNTTEDYIDYVAEVYTWLNGILPSAKFPNLQISQVDLGFLLDLIVPGTLTDLNDYVFTNTSSQVITEFENEYEDLAVAATIDNLVFGAVSHGWNKGVGVRFSFQTEAYSVLEQDESNYTGGNILELHTPNEKKYLKKGEIYRMGLQLFQNGKPLFTIPLGDLKVPEIGEYVNGIDENGNGFNLDPSRNDYHTYVRMLLELLDIGEYQNQFVGSDGYLYAMGVLLKTEVRIPCELNNLVDSYQIVYVERTETNRTIMTQGIAAPLFRTTKYKYGSELGIDVVPEVYAKWTLPFQGGPLHEKNGLATYDAFGENFDENNDHDTPFEDLAFRRYVTHRKLFYFDSPDFIYGKISDKDIQAQSIKVIGRLNTDHELTRIGVAGSDTDERISFSRRVRNKKDLIVDSILSAVWWSVRGGDLADDADENNFFTGTTHNYKPYYVNVSVFSVFKEKSSVHDIDNAAYIGEGEIISGQGFGLEHSISNNAQTMSHPTWFYSSVTRGGKFHSGAGSDRSPRAASQISKTSNISTGNRSVILKSKTDIFTDDFNGTRTAEGQCFLTDGNKWGTKPLTDTHALIELRNDNLDSVYGGRTKYDLSRNQYIPLGVIVPIHKATNQAQITITEGDTLMSLFVRVKNTYHNHKEFKSWDDLNHNHNKSRADRLPGAHWNKGGAWIYAVILETQIEARLNTEDALYREGAPFAFNSAQREFINKAYLAEDKLSPFRPRPHRFYDKTNMPNIISASKVKLIGDFYDSWSEFLERDFYELEKIDGSVHNIIKHKNKLFAYQKNAMTELVMNATDVIQTEQGQDIQIYKGTGNVFFSHNKITNYGTWIRGSVHESVHGITFFDPTRLEVVRNGQSLSLDKFINFDLNDKFENDAIVDSQVFYDVKYKETNIYIRTESGLNYVLSYNEVLSVFNGFWEYDGTMYLPYKDKLYAPLSAGSEQNDLHELNAGDPLNLFGVDKDMTIGIMLQNKEEAVELYTKLEVNTNIRYAIKHLNIYTNRDQHDVDALTRKILGNHFRYRIVEGKHTVPLQNTKDRFPKRGQWAYLEIVVDSQDKSEVSVYSLITEVRKSIGL